MSVFPDFGIASHISLGDSPVAHPSLFPPFRWDQWAGVILSDLGFLVLFGAFGLLLLSGFGLLSLFSFYRFWAFELLSIAYVYFPFQTFGLCRILYFECYRYRAFWPYAIVLTFILWWRLLLLFELYYYFISAFIYYYISKVKGVTVTCSTS